MLAKTEIINDDLDFAFFTETWLNNLIQDSELEMQGYSFFRKDRSSRGGGIIMFYKEHIRCVRRCDLECQNNIFNEFMV